jgi:hypothetical protein
MTEILPCSQAGLPATPDTLQVSTGMTMFLADELLPLMAGLWPASANQLDGNTRGIAMAWGLLLRGFTADQISEAVLKMAEDTERQFAPRPAEVRAVIQYQEPDVKAEPVAPQISIRACEMCAEAMVFVRDHHVTAEAEQVELELLLTELQRQGVIITGRVY